MPAAIPFLTAAATGLSVVNGIRQLTAPKPHVLSMDQAIQQAKSALNPIYDNNVQQSTHNLENNLISRGFFGQLPGAALETYNAGQINNQRAAAIANLAAQLQGQSASQAAQASSSAVQQAQAALNAPIQIGQGLQSFQQAFPTTWQHAFGNNASKVIQHAGSVAAQGTNPVSTQPVQHPQPTTFNSNPYAGPTPY